MAKPSMFVSILVATFVASGAAAEQRSATVYKDPSCGCCAEYVGYLERNGIAVTTIETTELDRVKQDNGVPDSLAGCHTTLIGGYVVEGHVPFGILDRLLTEKPPIRGISLPGMPSGSPGMMGEKTEPFTVLELSDPPEVYAVE